MGKASRWFRGLLGLKKSTDQPPPSTVTHTDLKPSKEKRKWSFGKSYREKDHRHQNCSTRPTTTTTATSTAAGEHRRGGQYGDASVPPSVSSSGYVDGGVDQNKHAIAVAAATAAVAEAAVAAAQAAAAVVRLTSSVGRCNSSSTAYVSSSCSVVGVRDEWAALKIQSAFRGYLAKRALRALKGLVKLQALVRGHIVRKRTEDTWRRMQVLLRAQARACAGRAIVSESPLSSSKSSHYHYTGPATPEKFEHAVRAKSTRHNQPSMLKRNGSKSNSRVFHEKSHLSWNCSDQHIDEGLWDQHGSTRTGPIDDEKSDKILEIDTGKPHFTPKRRNLLHSSHHHALDSDQNSHSFTTSKDSRLTVPSQSSCEVQSLSPLKFSHEVDEGPFCTAENSPQFYSASSRGGSSRRGPFTPTNSDGSRSYLSGYSDHPNYMAYTQSSKAKLRSLSAPKQRPHFDRSSSAKRYSVHGFGDLRSSSHKAASTLHANFTNKAYPGSGRLDRLGMPVRGDLIGSATGFYNKC